MKSLSHSLFLFGLCVHSVRREKREERRETRMGIRTKGSRKGSRKGRTRREKRGEEVTERGVHVLCHRRRNPLGENEKRRMGEKRA